MTAVAELLHPARVALPDARVRGRRITRLDGRTLRWVTLDADTADALSGDNLGWLVGGHPGLVALAGQLGRLDAATAGGVWVVVPHSNEDAATLAKSSAGWGSPPPADPLCWRSRRVCVATPERLREARRLLANFPLAGLIVSDRPGVLHKKEHRFGRPPAPGHRPQRIVNFRAAHATNDYLPPLLILTCRPLAAIDPEPIRRAYCLEQFHYIDGSSFACWEVPVPAAEPAGVA